MLKTQKTKALVIAGQLVCEEENKVVLVLCLQKQTDIHRNRLPG